MARRMIPAKLEGQLQKLNSNISEDGKLYLDGIVDADGHQRFIEGNIELSSDVPEGVSKTYGKWSLSGTHLMLVLVINIANTTTLSTGTVIGEITLPTWLLNKIVPQWSNAVDYKKFDGYNSSGVSQPLSVYLRKLTGKLDFMVSSYTATDNRATRIQFDLLIDSEQSGE